MTDSLSCFFFIVGSSGSGRARSDPTHQHHAHPHVHSHSAHQGGNHGNPVQYATMECESPQRSQGQHQSHQQVYTQQSWPGSVDGQGQRSSNSSHSQSSHRHHSSHHHRLQSPPSGGHAQGSSSASSHGNSASLLIGPGFQSSATQPPQPGRTVDIVPGGHTRVLSGSDPPQIGTVNMQLSGYQAQYGQYPQPQWPAGTFPFSLATTVETQLPENPNVQHARTSSERGDESPMVGVVVQQSPVASH